MLITLPNAFLAGSLVLNVERPPPGFAIHKLLVTKLRTYLLCRFVRQDVCWVCPSGSGLLLPHTPLHEYPCVSNIVMLPLGQAPGLISKLNPV